MTGLRWTYSDLIHFYSERIGTKNLNPMIQQLLVACPSSSIFAVGGHSVILQISTSIVAKVSIKARESKLRNEQKVFELLLQTECRHIVRCFFRGIDVTFLECLAHGTLHDRMSIRKPRPVLQWISQLSSAVACLEELGYAHGDINPQNVMIDDNDELKLIDFDHSLEIGADLDVGYEPYVRQYREPVGGLFGVAGPKTEQFALGSIFWYMSRGTELYAELEGSDQVDRLLDGVFPTIDSAEPVGKIIENCWHGRYNYVAELLREIRGIIGSTVTKEQKCVTGNEEIEKSCICEKYYNSVIHLPHNLAMIN